MSHDPANFLHIQPLRSGQVALPFELQPIVRLSDESVFGYEMLYRGPQGVDWGVVDSTVLEFLALCDEDLPTLFVNVDNATLLREDIDTFSRAAKGKHVYFEMSEAAANRNIATLLASKANLMAREGLQIALDDFGAGQDGFQRLFALDNVSVIKIDGALVRMVQKRPKAAETLRHLLAHWHGEGIMTVAEWIEDRSLLDLARYLQVDFVQGFYIDALKGSQSPMKVSRRGAAGLQVAA